ncbi:MAG: lytic transglycosylase domain-containing protein [Nitrospiraceae bacterium]
MSNAFDSLIVSTATRHAVDPALVKAVVAAESSFDPRAFRAEPQIGDASRGLMQTLFKTAQEMGYSGTPEGLFDPATSIEYGTRYLKRQLVRYSGDTARAVAAYNSGTAYQRPDGSFVNQPYVDRVMRFYASFRGSAEGEKDKSVLLRSDLPQLGPVPGSQRVPIRISASASAAGENVASLETFLSEDYAPWLLAIGGGLLLAALSRKRG